MLKHKTPHDILYRQPPQYSLLKAFGCLAYASTLDHNRDKFDPSGQACIFLGFPTGTKGYILLNLHTRQILISRNVIFHETIFPLLSSSSSHSSTSNTPLPVPFSSFFDYSSSNSPSPSSALPSTCPPSAANDCTLLVAPRRSHRVSNPPSYLTDYFCNQLYSSTSSSSHTSSTHHSLERVISYDRLSSGFKYFALQVCILVEPRNYEEAICDENWRKAMEAEIEALQLNQTWQMVPLHLGKVPIGCKWVYKVKHRSDGSIERYKARLVAKGYTQQFGIDYVETFFPVAKMTTI